MVNSDVDVDLNRILTPASRCVCLKLGGIDSSVLRSLEENDLEVAPVVNENNLAMGLVTTEKARELACQNALLSPADLQHEDIWMPEVVGLKGLFTKLRERTAILIARNLESESARIAWIGLLTIYDLNRHYFRTLIYGLLAELEVALADVIEAWAVILGTGFGF